MIFALRYKRNDAEFGRIEISSFRKLCRAFWDSVIDIDFPARTIWLYSCVYGEPSFAPEAHGLVDGGQDAWVVAEGPDAPYWRPVVTLGMRDAHGNHVGSVDISSLDDLAAACAGHRFGLWLEELELNAV